MTQVDIREVKRRHSAELLARPEVSGVSVERDDSGAEVLAIHVNTADPALVQRLPSELDGYAVRVVHSGSYRALEG